MKCVASSADIIPMWCAVREERTARQRAFDSKARGLEPRATTRRIKSPAVREKGRWYHLPSSRGGEITSLCAPKRHSVLEVSHNCDTDRRDSLKAGTKRTFLNVMRTTAPERSFTETGISPTSVH
eukprot:6183138-Pleurochrysis_carterae.AAC.5